MKSKREWDDFNKKFETFVSDNKKSSAKKQVLNVNGKGSYPFVSTSYFEKLPFCIEKSNSIVFYLWKSK